LRHTDKIENVDVLKRTEAEAGAMFMKRRAPETELCHFYDSSAALRQSAQL